MTEQNSCNGWLVSLLSTDLPAIAKLIAAVLDTYSNRYQEIIQPSQKTLMHQCSLSKNGLNKGLKFLESAGWITRTPGGPKTTTRYEITMPEQGSTHRVLGSTQEGLGSTREVLGVVPTGDTNIVIDSKDVTKSIKNKDINNKKTNTYVHFDDFWSAYPRKIAKKPCRERWGSARLDRIAELIIADVKARRRDDSRWASGFIPNPLTYLNQARWEDEIITAQVQQRAPLTQHDWLLWAKEKAIHPRTGEEMRDFMLRIQRQYGRANAC